MKITKRYPSVYILEDLLEDLDHNDCFNDFMWNFNFPEEHSNWNLEQFKWDNQFDDSPIHKFVMDNIDEIPHDCIIRRGFQQLSHNHCVPPHSDQNHIAGLTIFLNQEWDEHWGGHNVCMKNPDSDGVGAFGDSIITVSSYGMGVLVLSPCMHFSLPVFEDRKRRTFQIFYDEKVA